MLRPYHLSAYAPLGLPLESNHMWRTILSFTYGSSYDCSIRLESIAFDLIFKRPSPVWKDRSALTCGGSEA